MALEIQEIGIRLHVGDASGARGTGDDGGDESASRRRKASREPSDCGCSAAEHERIVNDCVARVLAVLAARERR